MLEILQVLGPRRTSELSGTKNLHGKRTLSSWQVRKLLRESGKAEMVLLGQGPYTYGVWYVKDEECDRLGTPHQFLAACQM